jgi:hypothetical protein
MNVERVPQFEWVSTINKIHPIDIIIYEVKIKHLLSNSYAKLIPLLS